MTQLANYAETRLLCDHCRTLVDQLDDLGFGYSRPADPNTAPAEVPDGVQLIALTGRTHREVTS